MVVITASTLSIAYPIGITGRRLTCEGVAWIDEFVRKGDGVTTTHGGCPVCPLIGDGRGTAIRVVCDGTTGHRGVCVNRCGRNRDRGDVWSTVFDGNRGVVVYGRTVCVGDGCDTFDTVTGLGDAVG